MDGHPADGRWSKRRVVTVLVAAGTAYLLALAAVIGVVAWKGSELFTSSSPSTAAPAVPQPGRTPGDAPPSPSTPGDSGVAPSGPLSPGDAQAALRSYDQRNAVAITKQTRKAWATADLSPILDEDVWSSAGQAAAAKAGHPFPDNTIPRTTLVRLLGSGTDGGSTWFAAVVTFGSTAQANTFIGVYVRATPSGNFKLRSLDLIDPAAAPQPGDASTWSTEPPSATAALQPVRDYLGSHRAGGDLEVDPFVDQGLWSAPAAVKSVAYSCQGVDLGPTSVATADGMLHTADLTCTRTSTAASGQAITYNAIDQATTGKAPAFTTLRCPVAVSVSYIATPDGSTRLVGIYLHQTATCKGSGSAEVPGQA